MPNTFTYVFIAALSLTLLCRLILALRQLRHVAQHREQVPTAFAQEVTLAAHQKAADYTRAKVKLALIELFAIKLPVLLLLTFGGALAAIDQWALVWLGDSPWRHVATVVGVTVATSVVSLPLDYYATFKLEAHFGFNRTTLGLWLTDMVKGAALGALLGVPLLLAVIWFYRAAGSLWWLYTWAGWAAFSLLMIWAYPKFLAPIFNRFTPLGASDDEQLVKQRVEVMLAREGFASNGLFVMDGSRRSGHGNAYFTGLGRQKRIVFFDTLLQQLKADEIEAVLAHELGHLKHGHVPKMILTQFAMAFIFLAVLGWLAAQPWFYAGLGVVNHSGIGVALVLFSLITGYFTFLLKPISSMLSRKHELEADAYAAQRSGAMPLIAALTKLYRDNAATLTPDPVYSLVYDSHPPPPIRIAQLQKYV